MYEEIFKSYSNWTKHRHFSASSKNELVIEMGKAGVSPGIRTKLTEMFLDLEPGDPVAEITIEQRSFTLERFSPADDLIR